MSKNKLNTMIDSIQETIAILDTDSNITFISNQVDISLGYKADELVGHKITEIIKENDKDIVFDSLEKIMWAPKAEFSCFFHIRDKKGNLIKVKGIFQNYFHDNSINGILLSFTTTN